MLTDEEIDDHAARLHNEIDRRDHPTHRRVDVLVAQAREANALSAENERWRSSARAKLAEANEKIRIALGELDLAQKDLAEAREQLAAQAPVIEAAVLWRSEREPATDRYRDDHEKALGVATDNYVAWLASRQPPTNVHALIASMVVARVTTDESGETKMEPATVIGFARWPANEPPRYNGKAEPCDMWSGPCSCGAWHREGR